MFNDRAYIIYKILKATPLIRRDLLFMCYNLDTNYDTACCIFNSSLLGYSIAPFIASSCETIGNYGPHKYWPYKNKLFGFGYVNVQM